MIFKRKKAPVGPEPAEQGICSLVVIYVTSNRRTFGSLCVQATTPHANVKFFRRRDYTPVTKTLSQNTCYNSALRAIQALPQITRSHKHTRSKFPCSHMPQHGQTFSVHLSSAYGPYPTFVLQADRRGAARQLRHRRFWGKCSTRASCYLFHYSTAINIQTLHIIS